MKLMEYDSFLAELGKMFQQARTSRAVSITMKRYDGRTKPVPRKTPKQQSATSTSEYHCLIRAKSASVKISTVVYAKDVNKFHMAYLTVLKGNMEALKRQSDSSVRKQKAKTKATQ